MGKEYIEREEALKLREVFSDRKNGNKDFLDGIETAIEFVQNLHADDVVEVRHGRVIVHEGREDEYFEYCSECGTMDIHSGDNYCPNCGCKIDKEE